MFGKTTALNDRLCDLDRLVDRRFLDLDRLLDQRFQGQEKAIRVAEKAIEDQTRSHLQAHEREHHDQATALDKMERRIEQRLSEFRAFQEGIERDRGDYVRRDLLAQQIHGIDESLVRIEQDRIAPMERWRIELTKQLMVWAFVVLLGSALLSVALVAVVLSAFG